MPTCCFCRILFISRQQWGNTRFVLQVLFGFNYSVIRLILLHIHVILQLFFYIIEHLGECWLVKLVLVEKAVSL